MRARVPAASNTQRMMSPPPGVKRTVKWRRQKLPSAWANKASVPSRSRPTVRVAERGPCLEFVGGQHGDAVDQRAEAQQLAAARRSASGRHRCAAGSSADRRWCGSRSARQRAWGRRGRRAVPWAAGRCPRAGSSDRSAQRRRRGRSIPATGPTGRARRASAGRPPRAEQGAPSDHLARPATTLRSIVTSLATWPVAAHSFWPTP